MQRTTMQMTLNWFMIIMLLLLTATCAVPQGSGGMGLGSKRTQQGPPDQPPPDNQGYPAQENGRK